MEKGTNGIGRRMDGKVGIVMTKGDMLMVAGDWSKAIMT